jgi:hypothetical protein
MTLRKTLVALALVSLVATGLASALEVQSDYDKSVDFTKVKTFSVKIGTSWNNELSEKRVVEAVETKLTSLGLTKAADPASADAEVVLHGATSDKQDLQTFYTGFAGGYGWGGWGMGMGTATTTSVTYTVGTLVLDMFAKDSHALIFRGSASDTLASKPEKNAKKLNKALGKMFYDFPPAPEKPKEEKKK